ncbi:tetratricopeptide repeat protein [Luteibaculum oceani]|uniref:Uncharacterized protein n=1 Tax=Luteibaculum oceani TaxID=1294296 RepID=A0A5C6VA79_9FLAO|nr:tetratricopeptide repeat protein [Luteibaculum oceani]TXC82149.1 hypothetical protein FRX97_03380 [Luteibaculum oceani]
MKVRNFLNSSSLSIWFLAMWAAVIIVRLFEAISIVESGAIGSVFNLFILSFWNDLLFVLLTTILMAIPLFLVESLIPRLSSKVLRFLGVSLILVVSLCTFYFIRNHQFIHFTEIRELGGETLTIADFFKPIFTFYNFVIFFFATAVFSLLSLRRSNFRNGKALLTYGAMTVVLMFVVDNLNSRAASYSMAANKGVAFVEKSGTALHMVVETSKQNGVELLTQKASLGDGFSDLSVFSENKTEDLPTPSIKGSLGEVDNEIIAYVKENNLAGKSSGSLYKLSREKAYDKNFFEAEKLARYLLYRESESADYNLNLTQILAWQNNFAEAIEQGEKTLMLAPNYTDAYLVLADIHYWNGNKPKAIHILDSGIKFVDNPEPLYDKKTFLLNK